MKGSTLKGRAVVFAFAAGAIVFVLALLAGASSGFQSGDYTHAIILAVVCGVMSWASAEQAITGHAEAVDQAIDRLIRAAQGDLSSPAPAKVTSILPQLAGALDGLLKQVRSSLESAQALAQFDTVTRLPNRAHFRREVGRVLDALPPDALAGLYFIDLDKFKAVNDNFGHAQGDQLLIQVADRLRRLEAPGGGKFARDPLIGRLAGDEFTLFLPELQSREEAERVGDALLDSLSEVYKLLDCEIEVGASIGVAIRPDQGSSLHDLMRAADIAMYEAKADGRGRCQHFTPSLAARLAENLRLERELRTGIDEKQFTFLFQPQISCGSSAPIAAEALLRWDHPCLGQLAPDAFLGKAEETGLIHELGSWAVEEIATVLSRWERVHMYTRLAVNVSARQIARPDFFSQVRHVMARKGVSARLLELEISESILMRCDSASLAGIARLREQGATVAIDDFGTGFSKLSRLKDLPVDRVKIDQSLITELVASEQARTIVQSMIGLVHGLGFSVVAEGVETRGQRTILEVIGCDAIQGHAIAPPMPEPELHNWLNREQERRLRA